MESSKSTDDTTVHGSLMNHIAKSIEKNSKNEEQATTLKKLFGTANLSKETIIETLTEAIASNKTDK